jgi:hypothetical protein
MRILVLATLLAAVTLPATAQIGHVCNQGETRCGADGYVQYCIVSGGGWASGPFGPGTSVPVRCQNSVTTSQEQKLCSPGDEKCGPGNTVLRCDAGYGGNDPKWRDTYRRCQ